MGDWATKITGLKCSDWILSQQQSTQFSLTVFLIWKIQHKFLIHCQQQLSLNYGTASSWSSTFRQQNPLGFCLNDAGVMWCKIRVKKTSLLDRSPGVDLQPVWNLCSVVGVCRDEERLASLCLLGLVGHWGRLVVTGNAVWRKAEKFSKQQAGCPPLSKTEMDFLQYSKKDQTAEIDW